MLFDTERQSVIFEGLEDQEAFFEQAPLLISMLSHEDYQAMSEGSGIPDTIAQLDYSKVDRNTYEDIVVYVNESKVDFHWMQPDVKEKIIQVLTKHEVAEFWYIYEMTKDEAPSTPVEPNGTPHAQALLEEWRLAFELGCHEEYFRCIQHWTEESRLEEGDDYAEGFLYENARVYALIAEEYGLNPADLLPDYWFD